MALFEVTKAVSGSALSVIEARLVSPSEVVTITDHQGAVIVLNGGVYPSEISGLTLIQDTTGVVTQRVYSVDSNTASFKAANVTLAYSLIN